MQRLNRLLASIKSKLTGPSRFNVIAGVAVAVIVAIVGYALVVTLAAGSFASIEPEDGSVLGSASIVNDASASGGKAIKFGSTASPTGGWPASPPAQICGNNTILGGGPASAPAGAITVPAGNKSGVNFNQASKTF